MGEGILELIKGVELTCSLCFLVGKNGGRVLWMNGTLGSRQVVVQGAKRKGCCRQIGSGLKIP